MLTALGAHTTGFAAARRCLRFLVFNACWRTIVKITLSSCKNVRLAASRAFSIFLKDLMIFGPVVAKYIDNITVSYLY